MTFVHSKFPAFSYRDFRILWIGLLISNIGSQMQFAAINWHIFLLTHSALSLGLLGLARFVPISIFALVGGSIADAHNRKKILLITQSILTILSLVLAVLTIQHHESALIIYIITALSAVALAFDTPPRQAMIPALVSREHVSNAMNLNTIMWQVATVAGPAISGFMIAGFGIGSIYLINAISFFAVIAALLMMKSSGEIEGDPSNVSFKSMIDGLKFVKSQTMIWSTMILDFFSTFFASATALLPIFANTILHVGPTGYGFLYAAQSVGAVVAGYGMAHAGNVKHQGKIILLAVSLYGLATIVFGFSKLFLLSFIALFLVGAGDCVSTILRNTIRNLVTPDSMRGRMTSVNMIFFLGGPQLGEFEAGLLAATVGVPLSVVIGGVGTLMVVAAIFIAVPQIRNYSHEI
jgi:MFS family permease